MPKRIDYRFRALVNEGSLEAMLVEYFRAKDAELSEKDMVMWANCACWIPLAQKRRLEQGMCSEPELKQSGRIAIIKLLQHIYSLAHICGLEGELVVVPLLQLPFASLQNQQHNSANGQHAVTNQPVSRETETNASSPRLDALNPVEPSEPSIPELLHHQDDGTFQAIFVQ